MKKSDNKYNTKMINKNKILKISRIYMYLNSFITVGYRRRIGVWRRAYDTNGNVVKAFTSISGDIIFEPDCFNVAKREIMLLENHGIKLRGNRSGIHNGLILEPYYSLQGNNMTDLSFWCVPKSVQYIYEMKFGINKLYDWQAECLSRIFHDLATKNTNNKKFSIKSPFLCISPKYFGKSLIAEIVSLYGLLFSGRNTLIILSNSAKCKEYGEKLSCLFGKESVNLRVEILSGNSRNISNWSPNIDIAICTIERANALINKLISDRMLAECLGTIIIEEINMVGSDTKGHLYEGFLMKLLSTDLVFSNINEFHLESNLPYYLPRIILLCMSKILPYESAYINWLKATSYSINNIPISSNIYIKYAKDLWMKNSRYLLEGINISDRNENYNTELIQCKSFEDILNSDIGFFDSEYLSKLVFETLLIGQQVLILCPTKQWSKKSASLIIESLPKLLSKFELEISKIQDSIEKKKLIDKLNLFKLHGNGMNSKYYNKRFELVENLNINRRHSLTGKNFGFCNILKNGILENGIAYHNSSLSIKQRHLIENSVRNGVIRVLCLAALSSIKAIPTVHTVIIRSINSAVHNNSFGKPKNQWISSHDIKEMIEKVKIIDPRYNLYRDYRNNFNIKDSNYYLIQRKDVNFFSEDSIQKDIELCNNLSINETIDKSKPEYNANNPNAVIFVSDKAEFEYVSNILKSNSFNLEMGSKSQMKDLNFVIIILDLVVTNITQVLNDLYIILKYASLSEYIKQENKKNGNLKFIYSSDNNQIESDNINNQIEFSLSYLFSNFMIDIIERESPIYNTNYTKDINIEEESCLLSNFYIIPIDDHNYVKSPIICSKLALVGPKTKQNTLGVLPNTFNKQHKYLQKLNTGKEYLEKNIQIIKSEYIRSWINENDFLKDKEYQLYIRSTNLGNSIVHAQINLVDGQELFSELYKARFIGLNFTNELQLFYTILICYNGFLPFINWTNYKRIFTELEQDEIIFADFLGITFRILDNTIRSVKSGVFNAPDINYLLPESLHHAYFISGILSYKGLVEKYRLIALYKFYYACLLRDICNPIISYELILEKYQIDYNTIQQFIQQCKISSLKVSKFTKILGWNDLSEIFQYIPQNIDINMALKNIDKIFDLLRSQCNKNINDIQIDTNLKFQFIPGEISLIRSTIKNFKQFSELITPIRAIALYLQGITTPEKLVYSPQENICQALIIADSIDYSYLVNTNSFKRSDTYYIQEVANNLVQQAKTFISTKRLIKENDDSTEEDIIDYIKYEDNILEDDNILLTYFNKDDLNNIEI
ncbi:uncharacterized protein CMU_032650 [Cryptosporidium muris RN66]|uniref:POLQ-like helical domain-containing protein n=1 Tax=Cryptosporidium muris (strain RN66) TaxID=441375 RepID=B6AF89_CRYMR|nr:uncharacterized protein CMU_032650 [Cryptosporidium muris RN66]EEA06880.1 hypothetical protein, conserved [Cryptosporidium muris RN66]|eukprot:XP_002141229.1 hypothetical protein [Cryptosporidium muris RN66]